MKLTLQKWGAKWCGPCIDMAKARTLEKFAKAHPDVKVEKHDDTAAGSAAWGDLADEARIRDLPTLRWLYDGEELFRSSDVRPESIEKQLKRAKKAAGIE